MSSHCHLSLKGQEVQMNFKPNCFNPGDIIIHKNNLNEVYLILEINLIQNFYYVFVLNHTYKQCVGEKFSLNENFISCFTKLKDKKL